LPAISRPLRSILGVAIVDDAGRRGGSIQPVATVVARSPVASASSFKGITFDTCSTRRRGSIIAHGGIRKRICHRPIGSISLTAIALAARSLSGYFSASIVVSGGRTG
jgi:hypothetical protein